MLGINDLRERIKKLDEEVFGKFVQSSHFIFTAREGGIVENLRNLVYNTEEKIQNKLGKDKFAFEKVIDDYGDEGIKRTQVSVQDQLDLILDHLGVEIKKGKLNGLSLEKAGDNK